MANNGGAAFPIPGQTLTDGWGRDQRVDPHQGMSLLDYFAAKAMHAAMLTAFSSPQFLAATEQTARECGRTVAQHVAMKAYVYAEAMLAEREKASK